jgi:gliding motility-associated-like protein
MLPFSLRPFVISCLIVFLILFKRGEVCASHSMGADLTYQCLGGNDYKLRLSFYRDCSGISAPSFLFININSVSCGFNYFELALPIPGTGQEITPICPAEVSTCEGGTFTGIQEWIYEAVITLPAECSDWQFSYNLCCRNGAITTIGNPLGDNIFISSMLNNTNGVCNNSPTFENRPVPFICLGQQFCFNHGSSDVDGDSLVYSPIAPKTSNSSSVLYNAPYSATQPLNSSPAATFNPVTGDFCLTPQSLEVTVMAVLVSEYRNGILIGQVERDIQITVLNCNNILPLLSGINGTNSFSTTACAGAPLCFDVFSTDPDPAQTVTLSWDATIAGATFTPASSLRPSGTFCWTPQASDVSTVPHCFTVTVKDDACPYEGSQVFSYCITVQNVIVDAGIDQSVGCNDQALLNATVSGSTGSLTYLWNTGATTSAIAAGTGIYTVTVSSGLCTKSDSVMVISSIAPMADFSILSTCGNGPVTFTDQSTGPVPVNTWQWSFGDGGTSVLPSPTHQYAAPGNYLVRLIVQSGLCVDTVIKSVTVSAAPSAAFTLLPECPGVPFSVANTSSGTGLNYSWQFGNGDTSNLPSPQVVYNSGGSYRVSLQVVDSLGCFDTTSVLLIVPSLPQAQINISVMDLCAGTPVLFSGSSSVPVASWSWNFGNALFSTVQNPQMILPPGAQSVSLSVLTAAGCADTVVTNLTIAPPFVADPVAPITVCSGTAVNLIAPPGNTFLWSNGSTASSLTLNAVSSSSFIVTVTNSSGCSDTSLVILNVLARPNVSAGADQRICRGDSVQLLASGGNTYLWSGGQTTAVVNLKPVTSDTYSVIATALNGCTQSDTIRVDVNSIPAVSFAASSSCQSKPVAFTNTSTGVNPLNHFWKFGDGSFSPGVVSPLHSYSSPGSYDVVLVVTDSIGCVDSASNIVLIVADPVVQIQVATQPGCNENLASYSFTGNSTFVSWQWNFLNGNTSSLASPQIVYVQQGSYPSSLTAITAEGCTATAGANTFIEIYPLPEADFYVSGELKQLMPVYFMNRSVNATSYSWSFGDGGSSLLIDPEYVYKEAGDYTIELIAENDFGCRDTAYESINIPPGWISWIPNAFSPNEDGVNDLFTVSGFGIRGFALVIYNRWGEKIYSGNNEGWNGSVRNGESQAKQDVYVYEITITDMLGEIHEKSGRVSLIR